MIKTKSIGILTTATSRYTEYVPQFLKSLENFCRGYSKTVYLFCDVPQYGVFSIPTKHEPYPLVTLKRYERFWENRHLYEHHEFLYHLDIDMTVINVGEEILQDLIAVKHPYFYNGGGSWETRPESLAYVEATKTYCCGGVNGGRNYLEVCRVLKDRINKDLANNIIPVWHDESAFNWYINQPNIKVSLLDAGYCFPEDTPVPFEPRIIALKKDLVFLKDVT